MLVAMTKVSRGSQTDPKHWFETIVNYSADGIIVISHDRQLKFVNPAMENLTGLNSDELVGGKCYDILKPKNSESKNLCQTGCPLLGETEGVCHVRGTISNKDGKPIDVGISYSIVRSAKNDPIAVVGVRDVTELAEVEELRSSLLARISHELQTPISIIKAYASTLARSDVEWSKKMLSEKLQAIEEESDRLSAIVGKLLYSSRLEYGAIKLNKLTIDLRKETQRIAKRVAGSMDKHQVEIGFPHDFPPVFADPEKIEEVFTNLIENAIKFSPNGGVIKIIGSRSHEEVSVSILDEGIGILPEDRKKLFDRFYRVEDVSTASTQGTGLGLYICRALIEAHGGQISVEGNPGKGTSITFSLPICKQP